RYDLEIKKHRDLAILFPEFIKQIFSARTPDDLARLLTRSIRKLTECEKIAVFLADVRGGKLGLVYSEGLGDILKKPLVINVGDGHVGFVAETGMVFEKKNLENVSKLTRERLEKTSIPGFVPDIAAPMMSQGILYGVICVVDVPVSSTLPKERMISIAAVGAAALEGIRLLGRFESAADLDPDTGLPGKGRLKPVLTQELERVRRFDSPLAVVELVIERSNIEDSFRAREFISIGANHLKAKMRNIDIGLRTGSDKITLLLPGTDEDGMESVMHKLLDGLPMLATDDGEKLGAVRLRYMVIEAGREVSCEEVLEELSAKPFISSIGTTQGL
ncbi:MAG: diguanylate cyclase, partial [Candidatus Aegiribacteria sp.]|nr:diguanylate cyclase [Candidatus Aegiribacteria sp.]MBD3294706.1 diguanylate cyclase [Candidatus Fermentibacteria bacterium]